MNSSILISVLKQAGYEPSAYSGRGMFGKQCVSVRNVELWNLAGDVAPFGVDQPHSDTLGESQVYYWPNNVWPVTDVP